MSSNLEKAIEKGLKYAENLHQMWVSADYCNKQKLQYLLFPVGMSYDKENNTVLTTSVNTLFSEIAVQERILADTKKGNLLQDCLFCSSIGMDTDTSNLLSIESIKILECAIIKNIISLNFSSQLHLPFFVKN